MNKCQYCGEEIAEGAVCNCEGSKAVAELKGAVKAEVAQRDEKIEEQGVEIKSLKDRLEALESLPAGKGAAVHTRETHYKGYDLANAGASKGLRHRIVSNKGGEFSALCNEEKFEDFSKFLIDYHLAVGCGDDEALAEIKRIDKEQAAILKATNVEGTDSRGGYLVPLEYQWDMIMANRYGTFALDECDVVNMGSWKQNWPKEDALVSVAWEGEEDDIAESNPTFGQVQLVAKKLAGLTLGISNELLMDSALDIPALLMNQFSFAINAELDNQVLNGTGSPVSGVLTAKAGSSVVMASGNTNFSAITADNLSEMISQIDEDSLDGAKFVFNKLIMHYIRTLKDSQNRYIYAIPGGGVPGTVWEVPYIQSAKAPSTSATSTAFVSLGNFSKFKIGRRLGIMTLDADPYSLFKKDQSRYRMVTRWGMPSDLSRSTAFSRLITAAS